MCVCVCVCVLRGCVCATKNTIVFQWTCLSVFPCEYLKKDTKTTKTNALLGKTCPLMKCTTLEVTNISHISMDSTIQMYHVSQARCKTKLDNMCFTLALNWCSCQNKITSSVTALQQFFLSQNATQNKTRVPAVTCVRSTWPKQFPSVVTKGCPRKEELHFQLRKIIRELHSDRMCCTTCFLINRVSVIAHTVISDLRRRVPVEREHYR